MKASLMLLSITLLLSCGPDDSDSDSGPRYQEWTLLEMQVTKGGCIDRALETYDDSLRVISIYCGCMVEESANRWSYDTFVRHTTAFVEEMTNDGTMRRCAKRAYDITGE